MSAEVASQHAESLFNEMNNEINKLIKKLGVNKAILQLKSINKDNKKMVGDLATYEFIIRTVIQSFNITETQLFTDKTKFTATDARRTAYHLIKKYLGYSSEAIAMQFGKGGSTIREAVIEFEQMAKDGDRYHKEFLEKHRRAELKVIDYVAAENKSRNKKSAKKK